ncbi:hypothetical protein ACIQWA_33505 [Kitasatospora sp. NPDC098652]
MPGTGGNALLPVLPAAGALSSGALGSGALGSGALFPVIAWGRRGRHS